VPLTPFSPVVRDWFAARYGAPTEIQRLAWPVIARGDHLLASAPTGTGKTLTGFLWPLDRLLSREWPAGQPRVLYVSPLKALNADIERNLRQPLAELTAAFAAAGAEPPAVRVGVRSGDTPAAERARQLRRPPEILITTPESLNLLLLSRSASRLFGGLRLVILDEIHAVAATKRGTHLITAVERLVRHAGEFQRVALSATVRPIERVARFVGGWRRTGNLAAARFEPRPVRTLVAATAKSYALEVHSQLGPPAGEGEVPERRLADAFWRKLAEDLVTRIARHRSTLVFTNSRRMAEKLTRFLNEAAGRELAWSHHGSLSREIRTAVEARLKAGTLPALVATSSLELGIDVGAIDEVVLLQTPRSLASAAQRIGRSGHRAGETSRGLFLPTHPRDFLDAAVALRAVLDGELEEIRPVAAPLDVLAQLLLSLVATEAWRLDELYDFVRTSDPYHELSRRQFDLVVEMLSGRYADARIEELRPRVRVDAATGTITGRPGLVSLLARAGGTIPDRGYFRLRLEGSNALLGELDEEFVWERSVGDSFTLGAQGWRVRAITANEVFVAPARGGAALAPFWRADARDRGAFYSERVALFLERAERLLADGRLAEELERRHGFEPEAAEELRRALAEQRGVQGVPLPHRHHLVIEESAERAADASRRQVVLYTFWGGTVNRPLALALAALWEEREGEAIEVLSDDDALLVVLPAGADARALLLALAPERIEELLRRRLEASGTFGAHFRQNAQRALLLPRALPSRRTPLWVARRNAKKLLEAVQRHDDFPLVLETWRTCLQDEFELDVLRERLHELASGAIRVSAVRVARPSPFAAGLVWQRTNEQMYEDDAPESRRASNLRPDLLREVALAAEQRPRVARALAERFRKTAQRLEAGYPPRDAEELFDWIDERIWMSGEEWRELLAAIDAEGRGDAATPTAAELAAAVEPRLLRRARAGGEIVTTLSILPLARRIPALASGLGLESPADTGPEDAIEALAALLGPWLRFHPPLAVSEIARRWSLSLDDVRAALALLELRERVVLGRLTENADEEEVAALGAFETLLRWRRAAARTRIESLPLAALPGFIAWRQGLVERESGGEALSRRLEALFGFPAAAGAWEREILPARLDPYRPAELDALFEESELRWLGVGPQRTTFAFRGDCDLFPAAGAETPDESADVLTLLREAPRGLELGELAERLTQPSGELQRRLWQLAWGGRIVNDSFRTLRQGIESGFEPQEVSDLATAGGAPRRGGRGAFRRWSGGRVFAGRWIAVGDPAAETEPLAAEERQRERVRLLADRYGVLFRELLANELPALSWARLARTLRTLELSGELVAGHYFAGVPGLQFASPSALRALGEGWPDGGIWWHAAHAPASLCGVELPGLKESLPRRQAGSWLIWRDRALAGIIRRAGREIEWHVAPDDDALPALCEPLRLMLTRSFEPAKAIEVESINGEPAAESPYREAFAGLSVTREPRGLRLRRRY
jgi:ATP-dependent Lhr-like helicase